MARVLAHAPGRRSPPRRHILRWALAAAVPLAAAAALVIWLRAGSETVRIQRPIQFAITDLGAYTTPTDVLLVPPGLDVSRSRPAVGCGEDGLGCPTLDVPSERQSLGRRSQREYA
jgi:hypothetical protein